jgi:uncharacterized membrane protein YagU involved in acid resistance
LLDITFAILFYGVARPGGSAAGVLQSVASGWLGRSALTGGAPAASLGLMTHFLIALGAAATFYVLSGWFPSLRARPIPAGIVFGIGLYVFMNYVVLPLSAAPFRAAENFSAIWPNLASHMFLVGVPIALCARHYGGRLEEAS